MANISLSNNKGDIVSIHSKEYESTSMWRGAMRRFLKHRMAVIGAIMLLLVVLFVVLGTLFFTEEQANKTSILDRNQAPSAAHALGTDQVGRDILARIIYGGQISLMIGVVSVAISISVGTLVGLVAGYFGGWVDSVLMRLVEALLAIPSLILLLMLSSTLSRNTSTINILGRELSATVVMIIGIIGFTGWMSISRIVRAQVLSFKEQEFIIAAKAIGVGTRGIIFAHIMPNVLASVIVSATLAVGAAIITEAYLSFLGFGVLPPTATWGNILTRAQESVDKLWWMWMMPSAFIVVTVLAINFVGDGLRDALDPRSIK